MMEKRINIAIDGHSSCGKSTLARDLARELNYTYIDSGAMYRAVAYFVLNNDINPNNETEVRHSLPDIDIDIGYTPGFRIFLNGLDITDSIGSLEVSSVVSEIAAMTSVRKKLVEIQQKMSLSKGVVMDGRDIASVVMPDAELKLFVTADIETRTTRRFLELQQKGQFPDHETVRDNLIHRDHIDSTRHDSPLIRVPDAILIDNSNMTREEQLTVAKKLALQLIR